MEYKIKWLSGNITNEHSDLDPSDYMNEIRDNIYLIEEVQYLLPSLNCYVTIF